MTRSLNSSPNPMKMSGKNTKICDLVTVVLSYIFVNEFKVFILIRSPKESLVGMVLRF